MLPPIQPSGGNNLCIYTQARRQHCEHPSPIAPSTRENRASDPGTVLAPQPRVRRPPRALTRSLLLAAVLLGVYATRAKTADVEAPEAAPLRAWRAGLRAPTRMALGQDGTVYIADPPAGQVVARAADGRLLWRRTGLGRPLGVAEDTRGNLLVANGEDGAVTAYALETWEVAYRLGAGDDEVGQPADIAVSPDSGRVYVVDSLGNDVRMYAPDGAFVGALGAYGAEPGQFDFPVSLDLDPNTGDVLVVDQHNRRVRIFNADGDYQSAFGEYGDEDFQLQSPQGIHVDGEGRVWLVDAVRAQVFVSDRLGTPIEELGEFGASPGKLRQPADVLVDKAGRVLIASANNARIELFTTAGSTDPEAFAPAQAIVDDPRVGSGRTLQVRIEVPGYRIDTIDVNTVTANGVFALSTEEMDMNGDGERELLASFDGAAMAEVAEGGVVVSGAMTSLTFVSELVEVSVAPLEDTGDSGEAEVEGGIAAPGVDQRGCGSSARGGWILALALLGLRRRTPR